MRPAPTLLVAVVALASTATGGGAQVSATLVLPNPSPYLSDWQVNPAVALLTLTNGAGGDVQGTVTATLLRGGTAVASAPGGFSVIPGARAPVTTVFQAPQIARWARLRFQGGGAVAVNRTGRLSDGAYTLCVDLRELQEVAGGRLLPDASACASFMISFPEPPRLMLPLQRSSISVAYPVLQWTPVVSATAPQVSYLVRLTRIIGTQTPTRALEANVPLLEVEVVNRTAIQYPPSALPLKPGGCFAWRIQALLPEARSGVGRVPVGGNEGRSEIFSFCRTSSDDDTQADSIPGVPDTSSHAGPAYVGSLGLARTRDALAPRGPWSITGQAEVYGEAYDHQGSGPSNRPRQTGRMRLSSVLGSGSGEATMPIEVLISSDQSALRQEVTQITVSPTLRNLALTGGHFSPQYGQLTLADPTLFGGAAEWHPGLWRIGALYGRARRAVQPDSASPLSLPSFSRQLGGARLGYGAADATFLEANLLWARDDPASLGRFGDTTTALTPQQNLVLGARGQFRLLSGQRLVLSADVGKSFYRRDTRTSGNEARDFAAGLGLTWRDSSWSLGANVDYVGPGYLTLGNSQLQGDHIDYQLSGGYQGSRVALTGSAGIRRNNLKGDLNSTATLRGIYNLNFSWQATPHFGLDASASNLDNRNRAQPDSFSVRSISRMVSVAPRLLWQTGTLGHVLVLSGAYQTGDNSSPGTIQPPDISMLSGVAAYSLTWPSGFALTANGSITRTEQDTLISTIWTVAPGLTVPWFTGRLQTTLGIQWTSAQLEGAAPDREVFPQGSVRLSVSSRQTLVLQVSHRNYRYGAPVQGGEFHETLVSLDYGTAF